MKLWEEASRPHVFPGTALQELTTLLSCTEEAETMPTLVRLGNGDNQAGKDCDLANSGTRMIVPSPHASVTCRADQGTLHRPRQDFPTKTLICLCPRPMAVLAG